MQISGSLDQRGEFDPFSPGIGKGDPESLEVTGLVVGNGCPAADNGDPSGTIGVAVIGRP